MAKKKTAKRARRKTAKQSKPATKPRGAGAARVREFFRRHPERIDDPRDQLAEELNVSRSVIQYVVPEIRQAQTPSPGEGVQMHINMSDHESVTIRVSSDNKLCGTMVVSHKGVKYLAPHQKSRPSVYTPWDALSLLMQLAGHQDG